MLEIAAVLLRVQDCGSVSMSTDPGAGRGMKCLHKSRHQKHHSNTARVRVTVKHLDRKESPGLRGYVKQICIIFKACACSRVDASTASCMLPLSSGFDPRFLALCKRNWPRPRKEGPNALCICLVAFYSKTQNKKYGDDRLSSGLFKGSISVTVVFMLWAHTYCICMHVWTWAMVLFEYRTRSQSSLLSKARCGSNEPL